MRMYDLIMKKRNGKALADAEIEAMIDGYVRGEIADYQVAAMLMAIYFRGMNEQETVALTQAMAKSGEQMDLSAISGKKVDKHSTGGVGDKTTLVVLPLVAACGGKVAKMSGRGLGHTGGTIDKLEAIPNMRTSLSREEFFHIVDTVGCSVVGQTGNLAPADKKLYALRDVTATVDSIPLIASSIMSKKLAAGSDCILLDVKTGGGAFMKTLGDAIALAQQMVAIGEAAGKRTVALVTGMDVPLGHAIGNSLEIIEVAQTLRGQGPQDLTKLCLCLAADMLYLSGRGSEAECRKLAENALTSGAAFQKLAAMVQAQGGDAGVLSNMDAFAKAPYFADVTAERDGYIVKLDAADCGAASVILGAGRETKESAIDFAAGIVLHKTYGEFVKRGDVLATLHTSRKETLTDAAKLCARAVAIGAKQPAEKPLLYARVTRNGVENFVHFEEGTDSYER